jgi:hypothetical protein
MGKRPFTIQSLLRRIWYRARGEQVVLITFWPGDYRRNQVYTINGRDYRITRYMRAAEVRFFEVWGREVAGGDGADHPARDGR